MQSLQNNVGQTCFGNIHGDNLSIQRDTSVDEVPRFWTRLAHAIELMVADTLEALIMDERDQLVFHLIKSVLHGACCHCPLPIRKASFINGPLPWITISGGHGPLDRWITFVYDILCNAVDSCDGVCYIRESADQSTPQPATRTLRVARCTHPWPTGRKQHNATTPTLN